jgi:hypothetical protein
LLPTPATVAAPVVVAAAADTDDNTMAVDDGGSPVPVVPSRPQVDREFLHLVTGPATQPPPPSSQFPEWSHEGSEYLGQRISRTVLNSEAVVTSIVNGWVVGWLDVAKADYISERTNAPAPLWHVFYQDGELEGDGEDLEEDELKEAIELHRDIVARCEARNNNAATTSDADASRKRKRAQGDDGGVAVTTAAAAAAGSTGHHADGETGDAAGNPSFLRMVSTVYFMCR